LSCSCCARFSLLCSCSLFADHYSLMHQLLLCRLYVEFWLRIGSLKVRSHAATRSNVQRMCERTFTLSPLQYQSSIRAGVTCLCWARGSCCWLLGANRGAEKLALLDLTTWMVVYLLALGLDPERQTLKEIIFFIFFTLLLNLWIKKRVRWKRVGEKTTSSMIYWNVNTEKLQERDRKRITMCLLFLSEYHIIILIIILFLFKRQTKAISTEDRYSLNNTIAACTRLRLMMERFKVATIC